MRPFSQDSKCSRVAPASVRSELAAVMADDSDYYAILGVARDADGEEIKRSFRRVRQQRSGTRVARTVAPPVSSPPPARPPA